jgi:hypothetical protein
VHGVAVQNAGAGEVAVYEAAAVVAQNGDLVADAGQNALAAAGEAGEEVGLDKALGYKQIGLGRHAVDYARRAGGQDAHLHVALGIAAVVDDYLHLIHYLPAQLGLKLRSGGGAVEAGGHQQCDGNIGRALAQLGEHVRQYVPAGYRAGVVGNYYRAGLLALGKL